MEPIGSVMQVMKLLGEGGTGQTWLCRSSTTSKLVAIKFIKRPIPKIVLPMLMYEIKVSHQRFANHGAHLAMRRPL